jgi:hypothetical protein
VTAPEPIWPGQAEILASDLLKTLRRDADYEAVLRALMTITLRYAFSECLFLACLLAREAGEPMTVLRYTIAVPDDPQRLLHAVLVRGEGALDDDRPGYDILGVRPIGATQASMVGFGPVTPRILPRQDWITPDEYLADQTPSALTVAGCLPWLARFVPAQYRIDPRFAPLCLRDLAQSAGFDRYRNLETDHGP